jgi:hypothetical protein
MTSIERRIERAEQALSVGQEPIIHRIIYFGGGPLPPEEQRGNVTIRHVAYESIREQMEKASRP